MSKVYLKLRQLFGIESTVSTTPPSRGWNGLSPHVGEGLIAESNPEAFSLLRAMFVPKYYADQVGLHGLNADGLFVHFLQDGIKRDISPTPLFQASVFDKLVPKILSSNEPAILRWLKHPNRANIVPTERFDAEYYRNWNPDVAEEGFPPFEHYIRFGLAEGRSPNALFDRVWYENTIASDLDALSVPSYIHFLCAGFKSGLPPRHILYPTLTHGKNDSGISLEKFDDLIRSSRPWIIKYGVHKYVITVAMFLSYAYDGDGSLAADADGVTRLTHFLDIGAAAGLDPGPMFNGDYYRKRLSEIRPGWKWISNSLESFLNEGIQKRITPTPLFDNESYCRNHVDIAKSNLWGFEHFIVFGIFEGRMGESSHRITIRLRANNPSKEAVGNWHGFWALHDERVPQTILPKAVPYYQRVVSNILNSNEFTEVIDRAREIEPAIGDPRDVLEILVPPLHDPRETSRAELEKRLSSKRYDTLITVPWLRNGGADLVACLLAKALMAIRPDETVLILRTDNSQFERLDWIPPGVDTLDISDVMSGLRYIDREFLLYTSFIGMAPKRIFNVNSRLCWDVYRRFGRRLKTRIKLFSYLFCWDQTPSGMRVGYPSEYFSDTAEHLDGIMMDTEYLRKELLRIYKPPIKIRERMYSIYTPTQSASDRGIAARASLAVSASRPRRNVLWGGRLDRQKRFDLVQDIAKKMPEVDFLCWGVPVLDAAPDLSKLPPNLSLKGEFSSFGKLPLEHGDLWLYTSAWDGLPTTLIELGKRGMAVVASKVGGIPELIDETTGWLVSETNSVDAYVCAIEQALLHPEQRLSRAENLQQRVKERFTEAEYMNIINLIISA